MSVARRDRPPPHCPRSDCSSHADPGPWRFKKKGFYARAQAPHRVQRYLCQHCRRNFSSQTFATTYWLKKPGFLRLLFHRLVGCAAYRQIARELAVSPSTVQLQAERLGRHCLLFHEQLRPRDPPTEPMVLDGFRSFEFSHYWPFDLNLLVGASHYIYGFQDSELGRSGRMRPGQKRHRERLEARYGRPDPRATRKAVEALLRRCVPAGTHVEIRSDEHTAYPVALRSLEGRTIEHQAVSSRVPRTTRNPLFPVNLADLLLRHSGANHKRETIAFSKRRQGALYRAAIFVVWRDYVKSFSERRRDEPPGVTLGVIARRISVDNVLAQRLWPWRPPLRGWLARCYYGRIPTRPLPHCRIHDRRYAV